VRLKQIESSSAAPSFMMHRVTPHADTAHAALLKDRPQPACAPSAYARPHVYVAPGYGNRAYTDYRHYGEPTTQDSLLTCSYC
jgi:hypothetical protein